MSRLWCRAKKNSGALWRRRNSAVESNSATTCTASRSSRRKDSRLSQSGDLYHHIEVGRAFARVNPFQRRHIGVVAADTDADVLLVDLAVVGGVVIPPRAGPGLQPGMASAVHGVPDDGVPFGVQVS